MFFDACSFDICHKVPTLYIHKNNSGISQRDFKDMCSDFEANLVEFDGETDHVHLLVEYTPKVSVSRLVNSLKGVSSRLLRKQNYPAFEMLCGAKVCGLQVILQVLVEGAPLTVIKQYIEQHSSPDV